jgi:hypothetical protein
MPAIPNSDVIDKRLSTSAETAKSRVRAIDTSDSNPLKKIGASNDFLNQSKLIFSNDSPVVSGDRQSPKNNFFENSAPIDLGLSVSDLPTQPTAAQLTTAQATPVAAQPERPIKETGFLENILDIGTAISEGGQQTLNRLGATGGVATNNPRVVVESAKYAQDIEARSEAERLRQLKKDFEALRKIERKDTDLIDDVFFYAGKVGKLVLENPTGTAQFVAEQIPNMATAMAPAFALGKVGAMGGTAVFPGIGTTIGGVGGFLVGLFGGNALLEIGGKAQEKAADGTFTDKERSESASEGAIKAGVITAVDAATLGTSRWIYGAGSRAVEKATTKTLEKLNVNPAVATANVEKAIKEAVDSAKAANLPAAQARTTVSEAAQKAARDSGLLDPAVIKAVKQAQDQAYKSVNKLHKRLGRNATPIALETLGEGVGEYLGELAATGEASVLDAVIESLAGAAQSSVELATIVAPSGAEGKTTNVTRNAILTEEARIRKEEEEAGKTRAEEDAKRTSDVRSLVANAIDVKKALATSNGVNMLAALHNNYATDGDVTSLIAKAAKDAGQELAFNTAKASTESINAGQQMISDSPAFAEEFLQAVRNFASNDAAVDTTPADSLFDEDIAAQERAGTLLRQRPTPTPPQDTQQAPPSVPPGEPPAKTQTAKAVENLRNIWDDVAGPPVGAIGPGNLVNPQRQRKYTAADLPPAIFKVMQALVADGYKTFKDIADQVIRRMRLSDSWRDLESQVTQEMLRSAYNQLPQFDGKERFPTSELTDDADNRNRSYNVGERQVDDYLSRNGYAETAPGESKKSAAPQQTTNESEPRTTQQNNLEDDFRFGQKDAGERTPSDLVRDRGYSAAVSDENFPSDRFDKTVDRARDGSAEALQVATDFVGASEKVAASKKKLADLKKSKANRVEIERATQEVERDTQAYNAAAEKLDRPAPKKLPASSQQRGIKDVSNREQSISRLRSAYVEAKKKVLELLKNGKIWEAREPWENLSTDIRKLNSQLQALRYESNSLKNEIATNADDGEQTQALRSEKREVDKRIRELEEEIFLAKRRFFDFAKEFYESKPSLPLAKLILEEISAIQNQFINSASDSKNNRGFERKPFPRTYLQALEQHTPFFLTIRSIIVDIYNSGETDINKAVRTRLGNWSYWVNAASKDQQENSAVANYKPFTDKQIAHMVEKMKSFANPANVAASFHSYKNAVDGDYSTKDGEVFRKRLERIVEKLSDSTFYKYLSNSAYKQLAVIDRIIDGTATPEEVASYGHFGGSISQDRSTYTEVASTASKDAAEIRKEIMDGLKSFKERLSKNAEKDSNIIDGIQNKWDIEDAWNTARDQVFFEMQAEYRRAIDAGLNANEVSNIFNEAMRNMAMVYAYKPSFAMDYSSKVGTYDPVLQQLFGDRSESMFPERNGTTADMDAGVRDATVEAIKSSEPLSSTQIVYDLVNDLKSGKITLSNAVQSVTDALRDKEVKLSDIIATLKAAKVERPSYIATITSHISLRYSLDYWVSKNGGGKEYVDQWLADHHSLNVIQSFKDIFVMNKDGEPVVQKDLLELEDNEAEAYKLWLSEKRRQSEASGAEIMADLEEGTDVLKNFAFAKYSINNLPQDGNAVDLINAWHRDIEYAIRKYPHLREQIISNDWQSADAYVVGADARAHKAWVESIVASVKESYASGSKKAKAVLIDLLETNQITEAEYDRFYDKIAIATQSEYQAIIDEAIELSRNYDRRGRNKRVLPRAKEDKGDNTINALRRIKHGDSHKARTLDELEDAESDAADKVVGADFAMNSDPFSIIESMSDDVDAGNAALDEFYDQSLGQEDFDESTLQLPNIRLRQGAYSGVVTAVQTQTWVNDLISGWSAAPKVHVVSRPSMIRDSKTRDRIIAKIGSDSGAKGAFDPEDGSVYIFSDYVTSEDDLEFTLFHEVKGHLGLRGLLGDKFDSFLDSVYRTNNTVREQVDQMTAAGGVTRLEAVEELLSDFNATERTPSAVANFVGAVIRGLRNIGLNRVADWFASVTTAEVQYVLNAAARWAKNGDMSAFNGAPDVIRLSSNPVPFEMFASKKGKLHGYARYDPLTNEWILFTDFVNDIRGGGSKTRRIADIADVKLELQRHGKIEERKRSSYFQSHKTPSSFVTLPNLMEGTALRKYWNQFVQVVQNEYLPVWRLMDHLDRIGKLTGVTDLRTDISLYERKAGSLLDTFTKKYVDEVKYLLEKAYKKGATSEFINLAMIAQHAEERNRAVLFSQLKNIYKGSVTVQGAVPVVDQDNITVQEYRDIYKAVKSLKASGAPEFKAISLNETGSGMGKTQRVKVNGDVIPGYVDVLQSLTNSPARAEIEQIGKLLDKLGDSRVDYMFKTGLVSLEDAANMKKYKNYRNLSGVNTELDDDPTVDSMIDRFGQKFNAAKGKEKRALGRGDIAPDVIARTLTAFQSTIIRGQKNLVAQKVLMVFEHNYDPQFIVINEIAKKQKLGSDGVVRVVDDENYMGRKDVMVARVHGRPVTMRFKQTGKGSVGEALHGMIYPPQQNQFLYWVGRLNRIIGQMLTTWNPLWVPVNAIRDVQTLYSNAAADGRIGRAAAFKMLRTVPAGMRVAVYANVESLVPRTTAGRLAKAAVLAVIGKPSQGIYKSYLEAKYNGGLTTFINHTSLEEQVIALDRIFNGSFTQGGVKGAVTGALDFTIDKVETLGKALEFFTIPFELGPRIAAYHVAKDPMYGKMTKEDAAVFSGEITVNFNMRGSGAPLRQLFLFFNPAVQGTAKMADVAKKNPARFATIAGSWIAFGAMMNLIGRALSGDDENGENKIDGIPIYKRATSAVFAADVPFAAIPIAYGYNALYAVGHFMTDSLVAAVPWSTTTKRIAATTFEAFSPVGVGIADASTPLTAAAKTISPQIVLPLVEYMLNENRFGAPIYMDESFSGEVKPDSQRAFRSVHPMSKFATDKLHQMTGGNKYTTEGIDINPALVDQFVSGYLPGVIDTAYKSLGRYMRQSSGLDVDLGKPDPFAARFTAYRPEMMDAAIFRDASKKVKAIEAELKGTPESSPRYKELVEKYPNVGVVSRDLRLAQQYIRNIASQITALEKDNEYKRIAGTLTKDDEARFIAAQNILRREQIAVYKRTTKSLIQNGFRDTVISRD